MDLERITVGEVGKFEGLNELSVERYFQAKSTILPLLSGRIIQPFEELLKANTGYNEDNLPKDEKETVLELGGITFTTTSKRRVKRPKLLDVYEGLRNHLQFLKEGYNKTIQRKGVVSFDGQPFVLLDDIFEKLEELQTEATENEVTHSLKNNYGERFSGTLIIPLSYSLQLTESDALVYVRAEALGEILSSGTIKPLEEALKSETGYSKDNVPDELKIKWTQVGKHLFQTQTIPEQTVKYADIIKSLTKKAPEKITAKSKIGDLVIIRDNLIPGGEVEKFYQPKVKEGKKYLSIEGMLSRLEQLKQEHTNPSVNQKIHHYPAI